MTRHIRLYNSAYVLVVYKLYFKVAIDEILVVHQGHCVEGLVPTVAVWAGAGVFR